MRLISQDGKFDIPYDEIVVELFDECVVGRLKKYVDRDIILGAYSTKPKAERAMEMLHRAYIGMPIIAVKDVEIDVKRMAEDIRNGFVQPMPLNEQRIECEIFKFPKDEDVEV